MPRLPCHSLSYLWYIIDGISKAVARGELKSVKEAEQRQGLPLPPEFESSDRMELGTIALADLGFG
jgi:hypothetical protein